MALRDAGKVRQESGREEHHRDGRRLGRRPEPVIRLRLESFAALALECGPDAEHTGLVLPVRQQLRCFRVIDREAPHHCKALGITLRRFQSVIIARAGQCRRNDHDAIDAGVVHHPQQALDGERLGRPRRLRARHPGQVRRVRLPQMRLRIDDQAAFAALRGWQTRRIAGFALPSRGSRPCLSRIDGVIAFCAVPHCVLSCCAQA